MDNYKYTLDYNSSNELQSASFDESVSKLSSVTLTRDALFNTRVTVYAASYAEAVGKANKALGMPVDVDVPVASTGPSGFIDAQIEARKMCQAILSESALLSDASNISIPVGLLRFLVDAIEIISQESEK